MFKKIIRNSFLTFSILLSTVVYAQPGKLYKLDGVASVLPPHAKQNKAHRVTLNPGVLRKSEFTINLFGNKVLVVRKRLENHKNGSFVWVGVIASIAGSEVVFAQHKGKISGFIRYTEAGVETTIELSNNRNNKSLLYMVDPNALPAIEPPSLPDAASSGLGKKKGIPHQQNFKQAPIIQKLLVAFTPAACEARGSCDNLITDILATIASTNQAYINSGLHLRIELAHLEAVEYVEPGMVSSLKQLTRFVGHADDPNGALDYLHALRTQYEADLVSLISDDASYCGVGWINADAETAFSVVNWQCLSNRSLAHELGHNQGNAHNRLHAQVLGAYDYSFGHRVCEAETGFRTIMSYVAGCDVPRVNHFSNPLVEYNGTVTGIAYAENPQTAADNVSSMVNTAQLVAGFMQADSERLQIDTPVTQTHMLGDVVSLTLQASSVVGRPLSFNAGNLPSGLSINATTGVISGTVSQTAIEHQRVTAYVSDGFVEVAAEFTWLVPDGVAAEDGSAQFANDACINGTVAFIYYADYTIGYTKTECTLPPAAPEVVNPGLQTNLVGELVSVQIIASDANHDTLSYSATGLPTNLTIDTTTGLISGTVSAALGSSLVRISVLDSTQAETQLTFNWEVFALDSANHLVPIWTDEVNRKFKLEWRYPQAALAETYQTPTYFKVRPGSTQAPAVVLPADVLLNANVGDRIWQSAIIDDFDYIGSSYWVAACVGQDVCGLLVAVNLQTATAGADLRAVSQLSSSWINTAAGTFTLSWSYDVDYFASSTGKPDFFEIRSGLDPSATPVQHVAGNPSPLSWSSVILDDDDYLGASYLVKACKNNGDCGPAQILTLSRQQAEQDFPTPAWAHSDLTVDVSLQFLLDWDSISDSRIDYFTIEEQGPVGTIVFYTETDSMALERAASGNYAFRIKACQRNRETGDRCGDYSSVINVFVPEFAQMFAVTDLNWFSVDESDLNKPIKLSWKYPVSAFNAAISRPDYFIISYGGAGGDILNIPHEIRRAESVDDYTWISETMLLNATGGGEGEFAVRACVNNGTNAICGSAIYINPWVVDPGPVILQTPSAQSAQTSTGSIPGGPDAMKPGGWIDAERNGSGWDFFWASELRYSVLHENYGETYDLIAFWYAYQQFPDENGNDVWLPVWFYAELKQEGEHFGGTLYYPTKTPNGEACDASNRCAVGQIEVIVNPQSNTKAMVKVTINKSAGLEGIVSTDFDLSYLGDDESIFGGGNVDNAHDHFNGMWAPASASSLLDGDFATSHWIDGWFELVTIVHFDHNGAPIWTRAKIDGRTDTQRESNSPLTGAQEITAVNNVHAGKVNFDVGGVFTINYGTNPTLANTVYPVGHPNAGGLDNVPYDSDNHVSLAGNGGRLYTGSGYEGYRKAGVWVDLDYTIGTGAGTRVVNLQIGSAATPMVMEKWANYHDVRFFIGEQPEWITHCSIPTNGECAISLNWFTDADYPDASLYIRDSNGQATFIHNSAEPTEVGYQYVVSNPGEYKFELWKHAIDYLGTGNALIAESKTLTVADSGLESGVVVVPASPLDGSTLHDAGDAGPNEATVGAVTGQAGVSGGAATYSIPINIPPGRQGMQPSVGISYSSRGGNGLLGMGWSLSATSSIHRCPATVAQDGFSKGITYADTDRLCLAGQRLIRTPSNPAQYWSSGSEYRTELDAFTKVVINGSGNNISFTVYTPDNKTHSYAARVKPRNAAGQEVTSAWQLTEETDTAGNRVNYYYSSSHGAGEQVLDYIAYTGDSSSDGNRLVKYTYSGRSLDSGVSDNSITYTQGYASEQTQLLTQIQTCIDTNNNQVCDTPELIREYKFTYKHSEATSRILLTDVEECAWVASSATCLLPTTFAWGSERPAFGFGKISDEDGSPIVASDPYAWGNWEGTVPIEFPIATTVGDFDGDGTREIVVVDVDAVSGNNTKYLISRTAEGAENWRLKLEFDTTSEVVYRSAGAGTYYGFGSGSVSRFSDVDNDGRVDLTAIVEDVPSITGYLAFSRWLPQGSGSIEGILNDNFALINTNILVNVENGFPQIEWVDMNNDGRTDAILIETESVGGEFRLHFKIYLNETDRSDLDTEQTSGLDIEHTFSTTPIEFTSPIAVSWGERPQFSDFDGNGQIDFGIVSKKTTNQGNLTITNGQAAVTHIVFNPLDDPENPVFTATSVWGSTALGAFGLPSDPRETYHQMIDVNGDGLLDMLFVPNCSGGSLPVGWYLQLNLGNKKLAAPQLLAGFDPGGYSKCNTGQTIRVPIYAGLIKVGDWNNDGRTDLIVPTQIHEAICWSPRTDQSPIERILYCPDHPDGTVLNDVFAGPGSQEAGEVQKIHHSGQGAEDRSTYYSAIWQFEKIGGGFVLRKGSEGPLNPDNPIVSVRSSLSDTNGDGVTEMVHQLGCLDIDPAYNPQVVTPGTKCLSTSDASDLIGLEPFYSDRALGASRGYYTTPLQQAADSTLDLLKVATNALGELAQWDYAPLSSSPLLSSPDRTGTTLPLYTIAKRSSGDSYVDNGEGDYFYFASSMFVVSQMQTSNGLMSGNAPLLNKTYYGYEEAVFNNQGRGFQGFRAVHTEQETPGDTGNDIRTSTWFHQIFPLAGKIDYSETYLASDALGVTTPINRSSFIWACVTGNATLQANCDIGQSPPQSSSLGPVYQPVLEASLQTQYDLQTRAKISEALTENHSYDGYGNLLTQTQTSTDYELGGNTIMQRTDTLVNNYKLADVPNWWINRLASSQQTHKVDYLGIYQPPASLAASPEVTQTLTRLIGWDTDLRKPQCDYVIAGNASASSGSDNCTRSPSNFGGLPGVRTTYFYNPQGNLAEQYILATDMSQSRATTSSYDDTGYFVASITNALNHTLNTLTDPREGQPLQVTDALGRITRFEYDPFGRELVRFYPNTASIPQDQLGNHYAPRISTRYRKIAAAGSDPSWAYTISVYPDGAPAQVETRDHLNRALKTETEGFDGQIITATRYNARGQLASQTAPRYAGDTVYTSSFSYDALGRMITKAEPRQTIDINNASLLYTHYRYHGLKAHIFSGSASTKATTASCNVSATTITSSLDNELCVRRTYSANQQLISTTDAHGQKTRFWANALGNISLIADPKNNLTAANYNALGQRSQLFDPNMGNWSFNYNGLGELLNQQDANNQTAEFTYDPLGRLIKKITAGPTLDTIIDRWKYDDDEVPAGLPGQPGQAPAFNQFTGLLGSSTREIGGQLVYARVYAYESNKGYLPAGHRTHMQVAGSLPESYTLGIDNDPYFARPKAIIYPYTLPNGEPVFSSFIRYNKQGYITQEGGSKQYAAGGFYRQVESMNAYGSVTREQYGNGLYQDAVDYAATGQLAARHVTTSNGNERLDYNYSYDRWGNLSEQKTEGLARKESFSYDQLHRLTASMRYTSNELNPEETVNYRYDALGNFKEKSDFANEYSYGNNPMGSNCNGASNAGPNAVTATVTDNGTHQYAYDANGNMLCASLGDLRVSYDGFNKPITIERHGEYSDFSYGPDNARYAQQGTRNNVRYIDKLYERINQSTHKLYLGDYAILTYGAVDPGTGLVYQHRDRLGSMVGLSDASGELYTDGGRAFDAFGKPREGDWQDSDGQAWPANGQSGDLNRDDITTRGFTQHEHLNGFNLIHMNGRAYDYNLGRFLSVDPIIQFPENSQSLNPYSYIMNNPMSGTDPSGYCIAETGTRIKSCVKVTVKNTDTGKSSSTELNKLHSGFGANVAKFVASRLGNGAQITGISIRLNDGSINDLMSPQNIDVNIGSGDLSSIFTREAKGSPLAGGFQSVLRDAMFGLDSILPGLEPTEQDLADIASFEKVFTSAGLGLFLDVASLKRLAKTVAKKGQKFFKGTKSVKPTLSTLHTRGTKIPGGRKIGATLAGSNKIKNAKGDTFKRVDFAPSKPHNGLSPHTHPNFRNQLPDGTIRSGASRDAGPITRRDIIDAARQGSQRTRGL